MTNPIDEELAWRLICAVNPGVRRTTLANSPGVWLEVDGSGEWTASARCSASVRDFFDIYLPLQVRGALVIGQLGQSLDGRIATESGLSHFVTGPEDIDRLHRVRAIVDAVLVGAGTVDADDPELTVRRVDGENPVRVVLDPSGRLESNRRIFNDGRAHTIVIHHDESVGSEQMGEAEILRVPGTSPHNIDLEVLLKKLSFRGLRRILVEGGGLTVSHFLQAGLLDRLHVTVAPLLIGSGRPSLTLDPVPTLEEVPRYPCRQFCLGKDVLFDFELQSKSE